VTKNRSIVELKAMHGLRKQPEADGSLFRANNRLFTSLHMRFQGYPNDLDALK